jgi:diguanylate cyclase (GGDEF)-like protein/putative nucleotidyltransferase with HDIG domain
VSAPITVDGEPWGALTAMSADPSATARAAALLGDFAELVAVAVANAADSSRLAELAATDSLTGLANHRAFQERLHAETSRAVRHGTPLSLMLLDLDGFKGVNDALGHQAGDEVLVALAGLILPRVRDGELLARVGGEEFALLLPLAGAGEAMIAAERLRREVAARPLGPVDHQTVSIGVCDLATAGGDPSELFRLADGALYWAKRSGRNRSVRYRPEVVTELSVGDRAVRAARQGSAAAIRALARAVDARDPSTRAHSNRVADLASALAEELGWPADRVALLRESAIVHDVGKIGIADAVLSKPGRLTPREYEHVKEHATLGARIVRGVLDEEQTSWVRHHHEHWDGRGYPDGLHAHEIPEGARIIGLADAWDAMTGQRAYRDRLGAAEALEECRRCGGTHFDPEIVLVLEALARAGRLDPPEPEVPSAAPDEPLGEADPGVGVPGGDALVLGEGEDGPVAGLPLQEVAPPTA